MTEVTIRNFRFFYALRNVGDDQYTESDRRDNDAQQRTDIFI